MSLSTSPRPRLPLGTQRVTISIPGWLYTALIARSDSEGQALSNLCAFLLERTMDHNRPH